MRVLALKARIDGRVLTCIECEPSCCCSNAQHVLSDLPAPLLLRLELQTRRKGTSVLKGGESCRAVGDCRVVEQGLMRCRTCLSFVESTAARRGERVGEGREVSLGASWRREGELLGTGGK